MESQTIHEFIRKHGIRLSCKHTHSNPHMESSGHHMDHWKCTLTSGRKRMGVTFSMGSGHGGKEPTAADVLSSLSMDASSYESSSGDFRSWCSDFGYDCDEPDEARKHKKTFNAVKKEAEKLKKFLGGSYEELLYHTEGL